MLSFTSKLAANILTFCFLTKQNAQKQAVCAQKKNFVQWSTSIPFYIESLMNLYLHLLFTAIFILHKIKHLEPPLFVFHCVLTSFCLSLFISLRKTFNRNAPCTAAVNSAYHGRSTICTTNGIRCVRRPPYNHHNRVKAVAYRLKRFTFLSLRHKNLTKKLLSLHA